MGFTAIQGRHFLSLPVLLTVFYQANSEGSYNTCQWKHLFSEVGEDWNTGQTLCPFCRFFFSFSESSLRQKVRTNLSKWPQTAVKPKHSYSSPAVCKKKKVSGLTCTWIRLPLGWLLLYQGLIQLSGCKLTGPATMLVHTVATFYTTGCVLQALSPDIPNPLKSIGPHQAKSPFSKKGIPEAAVSPPGCLAASAWQLF